MGCNPICLPSFHRSKKASRAPSTKEEGEKSSTKEEGRKSVTLNVANHDSNIARLPQNPLGSPDDAIKLLPGGHSQRCKAIHESSLDDVEPSKRIYANSQGFVGAAVKAYGEHLHLIVRPDDIWVAILTQLSFYINGHAEELRHLFVTHKGKKELVVDESDFDKFEEFMALIGELIEVNIVDPSFKEWVAPTFSTTAQTDRTVCSAVLMGALKKYFSYVCDEICGIPSVTLEGEKADWELLKTKLHRLPSLGEEPAMWADQLDTVITNMINCYESDKKVQNVDFWQKIAHRNRMCGGDYYTGWITAFSFWTAEGRTTYRQQVARSIGIGPAKFHSMSSGHVPTAFVEVPVRVRECRRKWDACIVAGSFAVEGSTSGSAVARDLAGVDTLRPLSTWILYEKKEEAEPEPSGKTLYMFDDEFYKADLDSMCVFIE